MAALSSPQLRPHYKAISISDQGVLLLHENGARVLRGSLYERLIPLLDGTRTVDQLVESLSQDFTAAEVYFTLIFLQSRGYLCQALSTLQPAEAAFWSSLGVDPEQAASLIRSSCVALYWSGPRSDSGIVATISRALTDVGVVVIDNISEADLILVVSETYLEPELEELNRRFRLESKRWLMLRPRGRELWLGPLFEPGEPGCHTCLRQGLEWQNQIERFASSLTGVPEPLLMPLAQAPGAIALAAQFAVLEVGRILAGASPQSAGHLLSLNLVDFNIGRHALVVDPHCSTCGTAVEPSFNPLVLKPCAVHFDQDGGHRHVSAEQMLERYGSLVSPICGLVPELKSVQSPLPSVKVVVSGHNPAQTFRSLDDLRRNLRSSSAGKGASLIQAQASALGEALERFCAMSHPGLVYERDSLQSMQDRYGDAVIHPNTVMLYSDKQFIERDLWNAKRSRFNRVPELLDPQLPIDWTPVWSISRERRCFLPSQLLMLGSLSQINKADSSPPPLIAMGCSNGNAAGNTLEEAVLQGFLELVERDSTAIWWYNRLSRPGIDLAGSADPWITQLLHDYSSIGREVWALDLTTDLGISTVVALSRDVNGSAERILMGLGCHLDPQIALQRALAEMNQMLGIADAELDGPDDGLNDWETLTWLRSATLANQPYLQPDPTVPNRRIEELPDHHTGDLLCDIQHCCRTVEAQGMEVMVLDQTRAMVGLPVVKVVVPGLRHFWARYAPGRLYDVPVRMGQLSEPLPEEAMNPIPIFF
jgi:ribosomal protein S12 methylthiotransferase accessory factor